MALVVHATFFNCIYSRILEKKSVFLRSGQGGLPFTLPTLLVVRPLKKHFFMCVFPYTVAMHKIMIFIVERVKRKQMVSLLFYLIF